MTDGALDIHHLDHPVHQYKLRYIRSKQCLYGQLEYNASIARKQLDLMQCIKPWKLSCNFAWKSAYNEYINKYYKCDDEAIFTNKVADFCDTIDYIYFNRNTIKLINVLKMPYESNEPEIGSNSSEMFKQFHLQFRDRLAKIKHVRRQWLDELLFCGLFRTHVNEIDIQTQTEMIGVFKSYSCTQSQYSKMIMTHDEFIFDQSFWRVLHNLDCLDEDVLCNAWSYPLMPNRKDPSDHLFLCCDFEVITHT
eukprot:30233_1